MVVLACLLRASSCGASGDELHQSVCAGHHWLSGVRCICPHRAITQSLLSHRQHPPSVGTQQVIQPLFPYLYVRHPDLKLRHVSTEKSGGIFLLPVDLPKHLSERREQAPPNQSYILEARAHCTASPRLNPLVSARLSRASLEKCWHHPHTSEEVAGTTPSSTPPRRPPCAPNIECVFPLPVCP
jgi:hypothetical protein